jgi:hypothetical protein
MHQKHYTPSMLEYWVVQAYDTQKESFVEVFKSYGKNVANEKLFQYLGKGVCAVVERKTVPML